MLIKFSKMHSLGNDFVVIDNVTQYVRLNYFLTKRLCDRRFGIGCDQLLILEPPKDPESHFYLRIFNQDGSEARNCLNGLRCIARFVFDYQLWNRMPLRVDYWSGRCFLRQESDSKISAILNQTRSELSKEISVFDFQKKFFFSEYNLECDQAYRVNVGNNHVIFILKKLDLTDIARVFRGLIAKIPELSEDNISLIQVLDNKKYLIRTWERGVGMTHACGSAGMASFLLGRHLKLLDLSACSIYKFGKLTYQEISESEFMQDSVLDLNLDLNLDLDLNSEPNAEKTWIKQSGLSTRLFSGEFRI